MKNESAEPALYIVCDCPVQCGMIGVVALKIVSSGKLVFFAPCCGVAWREPPLHGRCDELIAMEEVEPGPLVLPTRDDLRKANFIVIRTEPLDYWGTFMPAMLTNSWERTRQHLANAAASLRETTDLAGHDEFVAHNELQLAADVLQSAADERDDLPASFWRALLLAYENMQLANEALRCRFRVVESESGFVEAKLTLTSTADGGRGKAVFSDYRPNWDIGNITVDGQKEHNDARVSLEDCTRVEPGSAALVRLHPLSPERWFSLQAGATIIACEGSRVVGTAVVLRNALKRKV